jgi:hypothetical protein
MAEVRRFFYGKEQYYEIEVHMIELPPANPFIFNHIYSFFGLYL